MHKTDSLTHEKGCFEAHVGEMMLSNTDLMKRQWKAGKKSTFWERGLEYRSEPRI